MRKQIRKQLAAERKRRASMGPQLYRCGNDAMQGKGSEPTVRFNGAATLSLRKLIDRVGAAPQEGNASMGPQLYRCGNLDPVLGLCDVVFVASMGPQLYRCGNKAQSAVEAADMTWLQWGRNFIVAETRPGDSVARRGPDASIELMRIPPISAGAGRCGNKILQA